MDFSDAALIASLTSAVVTSLILLAVRTRITESIKQSVKHDYDKQLEAFRAAITADQAIQAAAIANFAATHRAGFEKRLEAIKTIWKCHLQLIKQTPVVVQVADTMTNYAGLHQLSSMRTLLASWWLPCGCSPT